jgi:hypothetical protein
MHIKPPSEWLPIGSIHSSEHGMRLQAANMQSRPHGTTPLSSRFVGTVLTAPKRKQCRWAIISSAEQQHDMNELRAMIAGSNISAFSFNAGTGMLTANSQGTYATGHRCPCPFH